LTAEGIITAKEISAKRYVMRLSAEERVAAGKADPERKEPGATAAEGADLVESRCLGRR